MLPTPSSDQTVRFSTVQASFSTLQASFAQMREESDYSRKSRNLFLMHTALNSLHMKSRSNQVHCMQGAPKLVNP